MNGMQFYRKIINLVYDDSNTARDVHQLHILFNWKNKLIAQQNLVDGKSRECSDFQEEYADCSV